MLFLIALPVIVAVDAMHRYLQIYAPSNLLVRRVRARDARWRTVGALFAISAVLLMAMHVIADAVAAGAPGWLNLVVLVLAWDAIKCSVLAVLQAARCVTRRAATSRVERTPVRRRAAEVDEPWAHRLYA